MKIRFFQVISLLFLLAASAAAQAGGAFTIEKSVIAAGGKTTGGAFTVEGAIGQSVAGNASGGEFTVFGGFFTPPPAPTAALVSVGGRVTTASGKGIRNIRVTLSDQSGVMRSMLTGAFGAYQFDDVPVGETYILSVSGKRFVFANATQIISVVEQLDDLNFVGTEQW